jgi:hypothetical protein
VYPRFWLLCFVPCFFGLLLATTVAARDRASSSGPLAATSLRRAEADTPGTVDEPGAGYPSAVGPVHGGSTWTLQGDAVLPGLGFALASAGDVNDDGFGDTVVGSDWSWEGPGKAYIHLGSAKGLSGDAATELEGHGSGDAFGEAVAGAGDVDGDGFDDVIVGAWDYTGDPEQGAAYLFAGSSDGVFDRAATTLYTTRDERFGWSVSGAGDVNADGYDDVIVGAPGAESSSGAVYVYLGSAKGLSVTPVATISGSSSSELGYAVAGAGDVNGDSYDDVVVGGNDEGSSTGVAVLAFGSATGPSGAADVLWTAEAAGLGFGKSVAGAGDVNVDGFSDVLVGAPLADDATGRVYAYFGSASGPAATPSATIEGGTTGESFGLVAGAGDVNHDGYDDVVIGSPGWSSGTGRVSLYIGGPLGLSRSPVRRWMGSTESAMGSAVAGVGDVNGDGYADFGAGAPETENGGGAASFFYGSSAGPALASDLVLLGNAYADDLGAAVSTAADVNGDGFSDLVAAATGAAGGLGSVYVFQGSPHGLATVASITLSGLAEGDAFGAAVASGDVNADGSDDLVVGAPEAADRQGQVSVFLGSVTGLPSTAATTITGTAQNDFGWSLADAGDVNADGFRDVVVGAPAIDAPDAAEVSVFLGSATGIAASPETTLHEPTMHSHYGLAVAAAGDVDGDGYDDVLVGAPDDREENGVVYLYCGNGGGLDGTATSVATGAKDGLIGSAITAVGDDDGDGYDDVAVGDILRNVILVVYGSATGFADSPDKELWLPKTDLCSGCRISGRLDYNSDGYPDLAVGTADRFVADVGVFLGTSSGLSNAAVIAFGVPSYGQGSDLVVGPAGDVNGDGAADLPVGSSTGPDAGGQAIVYYGLVTDEDGDGFAATLDCDDADASVNPGATEIPGDGVDQDCDGSDGDTADTAGNADTGADSAAEPNEEGESSPGLGHCGCVTHTGALGGWPGLLGLIALLAGRRRRISRSQGLDHPLQPAVFSTASPLAPGR